jgi:hypothetical protein
MFSWIQILTECALILAMFFNWLDWIASIIGFSLGATEGNPLAGILANSLGNYNALAIDKVSLVFILSFAFWLTLTRIRKVHPLLALAFLFAVVCAFSVLVIVVVHNFSFELGALSITR